MTSEHSLSRSGLHGEDVPFVHASATQSPLPTPRRTPHLRTHLLVDTHRQPWVPGVGVFFRDRRSVLSPCPHPAAHRLGGVCRGRTQTGSGRPVISTRWEQLERDTELLRNDTGREAVPVPTRLN